MSVEEIIRTHPSGANVDLDVLVRCIQECLSCVGSCTSCADACLGEETVQELVPCIRLNLDCADVCETTGRLVARQTAFEPQLAKKVLEACARACRVCAEECDRHAHHHEHCRICADDCRRCEQACNDLQSRLG